MTSPMFFSIEENKHNESRMFTDIPYMHLSLFMNKHPSVKSKSYIDLGYAITITTCNDTGIKHIASVELL